MGERWKPTPQTFNGCPVYAISPEYVDLHHDVLAHADVGYRAGWEIEQRDVRIAEQDATISALEATIETMQDSDLMAGVLAHKNETIAALRAELEEARGIVSRLIPEHDPRGDWWCPDCRSLVTSVSYTEHCNHCGTHLGNCQPGYEWWHKARAFVLARTTHGEGE